LSEQPGEINRTAEVIVGFNPDQVEHTRLETALKRHLGLPDPAVSIDLRLEEAPGCHLRDWAR